MGRRYVINATGTSLSAGVTKTLIEMTVPATVDNVNIVEWGIFFNGTNAAAVPVDVYFAKPTSAGTGTSYTPNKIGTTVSPDSTARVALTVEGGGNPAPWVSFYIPPSSGLLEQYPLGREFQLNASEFFALKATAPAAVGCTAYIIFEE